MSELRYHPFLDQWVITATHRQDRTFLPPESQCPFCPSREARTDTEVSGDYDIVVLENRFPSLAEDPPEPSAPGIVRPTYGVCEVVLYSPDHSASVSTLPLTQIRKLTRVWRERYIDLASRPGIDYVFIFENRGREIGVTLTHPHGQIYAYPFVPPIPLAELKSEQRHREEKGFELWESWVEQERGGLREVFRNDHFFAVVPFCARYPFETWVVPLKPLSSLREFEPAELDGLAEAIQEVIKAYDNLFGFPLPYVMVMHQQPTRAGFEPTRFHVEFYPPHRTAQKLKYLAGSESGAGAFINDTLPEESAALLREAMERPLSIV